MRISIRIISALGVAVCAGWLVFAPGFEPILTGIGSVVTLLGSFVREGETPKAARPSDESLSALAVKLLAEMDRSEESKAKGISLMMVDSVNGDYLPHLWNDHLHGQLQVRMADISDVLQAVDELEGQGFLVVHHLEDNLRQWRRTAKQL